jgi:large subunit ribosomal protein L15
MPLIRRIPKRGFVSRAKLEYQIVNLNELNRIKEENISLDLLKERGLIKDKDKLVKILGDGEIKNPVTIQAHAFSKAAAQKIKDSGGEIVEVASNA